MRLWCTKPALVLAAMLLSISAMAQFTATGKVTDSEGNPLIGVTVAVKGTAVGAFTDFDGRFEIDVPTDAATLEFSYIGYAPVEVQVSKDNPNVDVVMANEATQLDEVVVTGLATSVKRSNLANSVAQIDSRQLTGVTTQQTMDGALYGKFAGANIIKNSGAPGGGISIKLRGITSLTANSQPLFIIDGVYLDNSAIKAGFDFVSKSQAGGSQSVQDDPSNRIADIDPEDIETIEILKGASAAAIYGSRAGAGVVIITTKRGKAGKTTVNLSQTFSMNALLNPRGMRQWDSDKVAASWGPDEVPVYEAAVAAGKIYDYEKELYDNRELGYQTRLSVSGGDDKTRFFAGLTHKNDPGIVLNTGYQKTSFRLNLDRELWDFMDLKVSSNYIKSSADRGYFNNDNSGTTIGISFISTPPWAELHPDENGNYPDNPYSGGNPLQTAALVTNNESVDRIISGATLTTHLLQRDNQSLRFILRGGMDYYTLKNSAIFPRELQFQKNGNGTDGAVIITTAQNRNTNLDAFLVHSYYTSSGINFRTQLGYTGQDFDQDVIRSTASFLVGTQTNLDQASSIFVEEDRLIQKDRGFFAQEEVNFNDQIILTLGLRGDKSTNNGDPNQIFYYPKASAAVNVHEFDFWNSSQLSTLKLRVAYGQSGNFPVFGAKFTPLVPVVIGGSTGSLIGSTRGKSNIGPERQTEIEAGMDIGLLGNKVLLDVTVYQKTIDDLVLNVQVPASSGFTSKWENVGSLQNRGLEMGLTTSPVQRDNFSWDSRTTFWLNRALVTELRVPPYNTGAFGATLGTYRIEEGKSPTQLVGITDDPNDEDGIAVFGDAEPDFQMSFWNSLTYDNWELSFLFHWKKGGDNINLTTLLTDIFGTSPDYDDKTLDPSGQLTNGEYRLAALGVTAAPWIEDASYLRLREVGLFYRIPRAKLNDVCSLKVGLSGRNVLNFFKYNSYDPEVSNFGSNAISNNVEVTPYPSAKSYFFTIRASF